MAIKSTKNITEMTFSILDITNIVLMMPAGVLYMLIKDLLDGGLKKDKLLMYVVEGVVILILL